LLCRKIWQSRLRGAGKHDGAAVLAFEQGAKQRIGKAEVALHEFVLRFRAVDPGEVIDEFAVGTVFFEVFNRRVRVERLDFEKPMRMQRGDQVFTDEATGARDQNLHANRSFVPSRPACQTPFDINLFIVEFLLRVCRCKIRLLFFAAAKRACVCFLCHFAYKNQTGLLPRL
jgi:hypothetical protein